MTKDVMDTAAEKAMQEMVRSVEGIILAVRATNSGQPALCGVDKLLREKLGSSYVKFNQATMYAGWAVAQLMRELGYVEAGTLKCPPGCVAGQGILWKPKALSPLGPQAA